MAYPLQCGLNPCSEKKLQLSGNNYTILPNAIVKQFGKNTEYKGSAKEKIKKLSEDVGIDIDDYEVDQIGDRNHQERGLDVIGWLPFEDNCQNKVVLEEFSGEVYKWLMYSYWKFPFHRRHVH